MCSDILNNGIAVSFLPMEIPDKIISIFTSKKKLTEEECDELKKCWCHSVTLKRNDYLAMPGQTESKLFYVISGSMRLYYPHNGEEICVGFAYDHNLICSYPSFIQEKPSHYYIQALSKTELIAVTKKDFYALFDRYPGIERTWRMLEEDALLGKIEREVEMLTFTPEERYSRLLERSPHIFQRIPRKYIASYLRMSPETLSRIRPA
jgi:CRP-like cAMP-binding protein